MSTERVRRRVGSAIREAAGTPRFEALPDAVRALEQRADSGAFALREEQERGARLDALATDLMDARRARQLVATWSGEGTANATVDALATLDVVTVLTPAELPAARVLARSLRAHAPECSLCLVVVGEVPREPIEGTEVISLAALTGLDPEPLLVDHPGEELRTQLVPRVLLARVEDAVRPVLHLPPTSWLLDDPRAIASRLHDAVALLAPRVTQMPADDGFEPSRERLEHHGYVDPHLIGLDGSPASAAFLRHWIDRLDLVLGAPGGPPGHAREVRHVVMRSLELAACRPDIAQLGDRLTAYNALERPLAADATGPRFGGAPLRMLDLPGFDPDRPFRLNGWADRVRLSHLEPLAALVAAYARQLREVDGGPSDPGRARQIGRMLDGELPFDTDLQAQFAIAQALGAELPDPFSAGGADALRLWLRGPAWRGGAEGVTRHLDFMVSRYRRDIALAFGGDGAALLAWARDRGAAELGGAPELFEPLPDRGPRSAGGSAPPAPPVRAEAPDTPDVPRTGAAPVCISGYLDRVMGLGAAARAYEQALRAASVPVSTRAVRLERRSPPGDHHAGYARLARAELDAPESPGAELICVNPSELPAFVRDCADLGRPRIGVWGWETDTVPGDWGPALGLVDEVWVYSRFVAENLGRLTERPVIALPPPVPVPDPPPAAERLGVPDGFLFLFAFDYSSTIERKNPVGLIEAFTRAFAPGEGPQLLLKTINGALLPLAEEEVMWAARARPDVHVIDRSLSDTERDALLAGCDCYVSLHRSEGFGLTLAEAMALGKPVIATAYSGNLDFMTPANSMLVDYALTHVGPGSSIYPADGTWAEPDLAHAAALMRRVHDDPEAAAALGAVARDDIARTLSPEACGTAMRLRLERIRGEIRQ